MYMGQKSKIIVRVIGDDNNYDNVKPAFELDEYVLVSSSKVPPNCNN